MKEEHERDEVEVNNDAEMLVKFAYHTFVFKIGRRHIHIFLSGEKWAPDFRYSLNLKSLFAQNRE